MKELINGIAVFWLVLFLSLGTGCGDDSSSADAVSSVKQNRTTPQVYVVNYPLYYLTQRIAGDHLDVILPEASGTDPAFWNPSDEDVQGYQLADLVILWGADYAKWVKRVSLPNSRLVDSGESIRDQYIHDEEAVTHSHGNSGAHSHGATASTTWLDFELLAKQARTVHETLATRFPQHAIDFETAFRALEADLKALDDQARASVPDSFEGVLFASHPHYQYFARRYGLEIMNFHWEPGLTPPKEEWARFQERLRETPTKWMLWEGSPSEPARERMEELGVTPIVFPTLAGIPEEGDFLSGMKATLETLRVAWQKG